MRKPFIIDQQLFTIFFNHKAEKVHKEHKVFSSAVLTQYFVYYISLYGKQLEMLLVNGGLSADFVVQRVSYPNNQ